MPRKRITDFNAHINSLELGDWGTIFSFVPKIKSTKSFGELAGIEENENGTFSFPYYVVAPVVEKFTQTLYKLKLVIDFDWPGWKEGWGLIEEKQNFEECDIESLFKLLTLIIRHDRFSEGFLVSCFKDGTVLRILEVLEKKNVLS